MKGDLALEAQRDAEGVESSERGHHDGKQKELRVGPESAGLVQREAILWRTIEAITLERRNTSSLSP